VAVRRRIYRRVVETAQQHRRAGIIFATKP